MKKLIALSLTVILFSSCSMDNEAENFSFEILPIESVEIPEEFTNGETYSITVTYFKPSECHAFKEFYYTKEDNKRTVAIIDYVYERSDCEVLKNELQEATFNFIVANNESYVFKFWQGKDDAGEDQYLTKEVSVTD